MHVEKPQELAESAQAQLEKNLNTARELGAEVVVTADEDLVRGLLRVAHAQNATQIIVGKSTGAGWLDWLQADWLWRKLARQSGDIDIHVVRAEKIAELTHIEISKTRVCCQFSSIFICSLCCGSYGYFESAHHACGRTSGAGACVFASRCTPGVESWARPSVCWPAPPALLSGTSFFLPPRFTFIISKAEDAVLFALYFIVAIVLGQLVARIRAQEQAERHREERATALYEMSRDLSEANSRDEVIWQLVKQINRVLHAPAAVALPVNDKLVVHPDSSLTLSDKELSVADWAFRQRKPAGRFTDNLPGAEAFHLPLVTERKSFGVLALNLPDKSLSLEQRDLLETFIRQTAVVLDRMELRSTDEQSRLLAESEKFSRTLLNSISHELRTPLAASTSAASSLAAGELGLEQQHALIAEIQEANARLNRIVSNLLDMARLESGQVRPRLDWHDARDLVQTTLRDLQRELMAHPVKMDMPAEPLLVKLDFSLALHALANLLLNAATHTPPGTPIEVRAQCSNSFLILTVADRGPGIPLDILPRIFDKFFRAPGALAGGSGLGLSIAKGFVESHGGTITVANRPGGGAIFNLRFPQKEKPPSIEPN